MATIFACSRCGEEFQSANARTSHSRSVHRSTYQLQLNNGTTQIIEKADDGRFHCPVATCSSSYPRSDGLRLHFRRKHNETVEHDPSMDVDNLINSQGSTTIADHDLSSTPDMLSNAKLCIIHHNGLVLLVCLQCHTALQHTEGTSIIRHVRSHRTSIPIPTAEQVLVSLQGVLFTDTNDMSLLPYTSEPTAELLSPIPGVLIHRGFSCSRCIFFCRSRRTMANHRCTKHSHLGFEDIATPCQVQALFKGVGRKFYGVDHGNEYLGDDVVAQSTRGLVEKAFQGHLQSLQTDLAPPVRELAPWLRVSRWHEIALEFMPEGVPFEDVQSEMKLPRPAERGSPMSYLGTVVLAYMQRTRRLLSGNVDYRLQRMVMKTSPTSDVTRGLSALQEKTTIPQYCAPMVSLLQCLLRSSAHESRPRHCVVYTDRADVKDALQQLMAQLSQPSETRPTSETEIDLTGIHRVLVLLWTPEIPELLYAHAPADCMFTRFFILHSMLSDGRGSQSTGYKFCKIGKVTKVLAILHYWARCTILMELSQALWHPNPRGLPRDEVKRLEKYISDVAEDTPFNAVRQYMRLAKTIHVGSDKQPTLVHMDDTQTACAIEGDSITLNAFRDMVHAIAEEAQVTLDHDVLLGLDSKWIDNLVRTKGSIHDANLTDQVEYSFLTDPRNPEFQQHGKDLLNHMFGNPMMMANFIVREDHQGNEVIWNKTSLHKWMAASSKLQMLLNLLVHFCAGLPARGEEYSSLLIRNTATGDRAFIWLSDLLMVYQSYHKCANAGRPINLTARFIPETQSHLFVKMLCLVRPVQSFVANILWGSDVANIYHNCWFVAMDKRLTGNDLSSSVRDAFQKHCGIPFGIAKYRHVAALWSENIRACKAYLQEDLVDATGGHQTATVGHHYARSTKDPRGMDGHVLRGCVLVSQLWHKLLGITWSGRPNGISIAAPLHFLGPVGGLEYEVRQVPKKRRFTVYHSNIHDTPPTSEENDLLLQVALNRTARACQALRRLGHQEWKSVEQATAVALSVDNVVDFVAILPTGSGKSLVFMAPSTMGPSKTVIVVVPLNILVEGHVDECRQANISCTVYRDDTIEVANPPSIIFVAVEIAAKSTRFLILAKQLKCMGSLHSIIFDEVHLLLSDFRPVMKQLLPLLAIPCQVIGLTASLAPKNQIHIERMLSTEMGWIRCPTIRPNIRYVVLETRRNMIDDKIVNLLHTWAASSLPNERALVFCMTRDEVESMASILQQQGLQCAYMHAHLDITVKKASLNSWTSGVCKIMVATGVISCGYNYKWVRLVIHRGSFRSLESFHQESGRAGRDGLVASSYVVTNHEYRNSAARIHPTIGASHAWIENKATCRRFGLHGDVDGKVQVCHLIPSAVLCDLCDLESTRCSRGIEVPTRRNRSTEASFPPPQTECNSNEVVRRGASANSNFDSTSTQPPSTPMVREEQNISLPFTQHLQEEEPVVARLRAVANARSIESDKQNLYIVRDFAGDGSQCLLCKHPESREEKMHDTFDCPILRSLCFKCLGSHHARMCNNGFPQNTWTCFKCHFQHIAIDAGMCIHKGPYGGQCTDRTGERLRHFVWQGWRISWVQTELFKEFPEIRYKTEVEFAAWLMHIGVGKVVSNFVLFAAAIVKIKYPQYS